MQWSVFNTTHSTLVHVDKIIQSIYICSPVPKVVTHTCGLLPVQQVIHTLVSGQYI